MPDLKQTLNNYFEKNTLNKESNDLTSNSERGIEKRERFESFDVKKNEQPNIVNESANISNGIYSIKYKTDGGSETEKMIEKILEKDLEKIYLALSSSKKEEFKEKGEETAMEIDNLISSAKATAEKIMDLIKRWFSLLPGVNKFFLEQEAKIKTDEILKLNKNI